jgi:hypothetical protein
MAGLFWGKKPWSNTSANQIFDSSWQFLGGGLVAMADPMLVSLKQAVATDQSLLEFADLPLGWKATRENAQSPWTLWSTARTRRDTGHHLVSAGFEIRHWI